MSSPVITNLVNRYTLNARQSFTCEPARPCYRYRTCQKCLDNKRSFILQQVSQLYFAWGLDTFLTISFTKIPLHPQDALKHLQKMRRRAFRHIPSGTRYICFMACEIGPRGSNPHLHLLIGAQDNQRYLRLPMRSCATLGIPNFKELEVEDLGAALRIAGYLFDRNFVTTLPYMPKRVRLISGSLGFKAGRPIKVFETLWHQAAASF